jgi:hypothetical protein
MESNAPSPTFSRFMFWFNDRNLLKKFHKTLKNLLSSFQKVGLYDLRSVKSPWKHKGGKERKPRDIHQEKIINQHMK